MVVIDSIVVAWRALDVPSFEGLCRSPKFMIDIDNCTQFCEYQCRYRTLAGSGIVIACPQGGGATMPKK
jgi:hypothetical protein